MFRPFFRSRMVQFYILSVFCGWLLICRTHCPVTSILVLAQKPIRTWKSSNKEENQQKSRKANILNEEMQMHGSLLLSILGGNETWLVFSSAVFFLLLCFFEGADLRIWSAFTRLYNTSATACRRPFFLPMVRVGLLFDLRHCDTQPRGF